LQTRAGEFQAPVVIDAAGAWGDALAVLGGIAPIGLQPMRRTALTFDPGHDVTRWPMVNEIAEEFYFKPEAGHLMLSLADETPSEPCDAQPDEYDLAVAIDRMEQATEMSVRRMIGKWAGLRSFLPDRTPVAGFDVEKPGFFWLIGQGGYGIHTSPALGRATAAVVTGGEWPTELTAVGITPLDLSPARPSMAAARAATS
jgi:D-arginine dehydrogenase